MNIQEFRQKYPQYGDISDEDLARKLHAKHYADMPYETFSERFIGAMPSPEIRTVPKGEGVFQSVGQGATFGFADEIDATGDSLSNKLSYRLSSMFGPETPDWIAGAERKSPNFGQLYDENVARRRQLVSDFKEQDPKTALAAEIGGALVGPNPLGKIGALAKLGKAGGVAGRVAANAIRGGVEGGVSGYGQAEGSVMDRLGGAAKGALYGTALGGAFAAAAPAIRATIGAIRSPFRAADEVATEALSRELNRAGMSPAAAQQAVEGLGESGALADVSRGMQQLAGQAARTPGRAQETAEKFLEARAADMGGRVSGAIEEALGQGKNTGDVVASLIAKRSQEANEAFAKAAQEAGDVAEPGILAMLRQPVFQDAYKQYAAKVARASGTPIKGLYAADGALARAPTLRELDLIRRGMADMQNAAYTSGKGALGAAIKDQAKAFRTILEEAAPETYRKALKSYRDDSVLMEAAEAGKDAFTGAFRTARDLERHIGTLSKAEQDVFRTAAVDGLLKKVADSKDGSAVISNLFNSEVMRKKLRLLVPNEDAYKGLLTKLSAEQQMGRTRTAAFGGSQTAERLARGEDADALLATGRQMAQGPTGWLGLAAQYLVDKAKGLNEQAKAKIAEQLYNSSPEQIQAALRRVNDSQAKKLAEEIAREQARKNAASRLGRIGGLLSNED